MVVNGFNTILFPVDEASNVGQDVINSFQNFNARQINNFNLTEYKTNLIKSLNNSVKNLLI